MKKTLSQVIEHQEDSLKRKWESPNVTENTIWFYGNFNWLHSKTIVNYNRGTQQSYIGWEFKTFKMKENLSAHTDRHFSLWRCLELASHKSKTKALLNLIRNYCCKGHYEWNRLQLTESSHHKKKNIRSIHLFFWCNIRFLVLIVLTKKSLHQSKFHF